MIAIGLLLYAAKLYKSGDGAQGAAAVMEKIGTYGGLASLVLLLLAGGVYGWCDCVFEGAEARLDALAALGCNAVEPGVGEICVSRAIDAVGEVQVAAMAKAWASSIAIVAVIL